MGERYNAVRGRSIRKGASTVGRCAVNGVSIPAVHVRMGVNGLPAAFFNMNFWYRKSDVVLVKSVGAEDGPGSPVTVVELVGP